jgi:DNA-binding transcriptional MerR regulator
MAEAWRLITEVAENLNMPESTARRYVKLFNEFLPQRTVNRVTRYGPEAAEILLQVAEFYRQGLTTAEAKERLSGTVPQVFDMKDTESSTALTPVERLAVALETLANQRAAIERIDERGRQLEAKDRELEEKINDIQTRLRQLEEQKKEPRKTVDNSGVVAWWKKLFRRETT